MSNAYVGTSGFSYKHWRGSFYPEDLAQSKWFRYYCDNFSTVELNVTFYRLPKKETFMKWHSETPEDFKFSLKGSRFITHIKRLKDPVDPLKTFMGAIRPLGPKIGVVLWQLPPNFKKDTDRLKDFLKALRRYRRRAVLEFRHETWIDEKVFGLLKDEGIGLCMADWPPYVNNLPITSDYVYIRRHGKGGNYDTLYTRSELNNDAKRIRYHLKRKKDVFIYFNNDAFGYAAQNALELKEILKS